MGRGGKETLAPFSFRRKTDLRLQVSTAKKFTIRHGKKEKNKHGRDGYVWNWLGHWLTWFKGGGDVRGIWKQQNEEEKGRNCTKNVKNWMRQPKLPKFSKICKLLSLVKPQFYKGHVKEISLHSKCFRVVSERTRRNEKNGMSKRAGRGWRVRIRRKVR